MRRFAAALLVLIALALSGCSYMLVEVEPAVEVGR